jgi:RNA polymerase sigma-70 factor (ECF subfamily)
MSAAITQDRAKLTGTGSGHRGLLDLQRAAPLVEPAGRRSPPAAIDARRIDDTSQAWLDALRSPGARRDEAIERLHALLLREASFEVRRRAATLAHPSGRDLDDLAMQAANDSLVAVLAKLDQFRGESLFTTWARRFAEREAPAKIRRRLGATRELPTDEGLDRGTMWAVADPSPHEQSVANESARTLARLISEELTAHQREVLVALVIDGEATDDLAGRLHTTTGALYKTLHDARRKLEVGFAEASP